MATTIGNLVIKVSASIGALKGDLAEGAAAAKSFASKTISALGPVNEFMGSLGREFLKGKNPFERIREDVTGMFKNIPLAGVALATLEGKIDKAINKLTEFRKVGMKLGADAGDLSTLKFAAKDQFEDLVHGLEKYQVKLGEAQQGSRDAQQAFQSLGLAWDSLSESKFPDQLDAIIARYKTLNAGAEKAVFTHKLFGKAGPELIPVFEKLAKGMKLTSDEAERLGQKVSNADVAAAFAARKGMKEFEMQVDGLWTKIAINLLPTVTALNNGLANLGQGKIGAGLGDLSHLLGALPGAWAGARLGSAFGPYGTAIGGVIGAAASSSFLERLRTGGHGSYRAQQAAYEAQWAEQEQSAAMRVAEALQRKEDMQKKYLAILASVSPLDNYKNKIAELDAAEKAEAVTTKDAIVLKREFGAELLRGLGVSVDPLDAYGHAVNRVAEAFNDAKISRDELERGLKSLKDQLLGGLGLERSQTSLQRFSEQMRRIGNLPGTFSGAERDKLRTDALDNVKRDLGLLANLDPFEKYARSLKTLNDFLTENKFLLQQGLGGKEAALGIADKTRLVKGFNDELLKSLGVDVETPYEKLTQRLREIAKLKQLGLLTDAKAAVQAAKLTDEALAQAHLLEQRQAPGALLFGSAAEYSARHDFERGGNDIANPLEAIRKASEANAAEVKRGNGILEKIANKRLDLEVVGP